MSKRSKTINHDPLLKKALELGFVIKAGTKHWILTHPSGGRTITSYNGARKRSPANERNFLADLHRITRLT